MPISTKNCNTKECFFCKGCLPEWLPAIKATRKNISFKKGQLIFKEGDKVNGIYFVYKGLVKVHKKWSDDKELILRFAKNGAILGHRGLGGDNFYPISATALEPTIVCYFDVDFFTASLKVNPDFTYQLMMFYAEELKESEKRMRNLAHMSVKGRVAYALLLLNRKFGTASDGGINIIISRQDMASYVGAAYETVFRTLGEFSEQSFISISGKYIRLINTPELIKLSDN